MAYQALPLQTEDEASSGGEKGVFLLGVRQDSENSPVSANGDYHPFVFNELGRLKVASTPALNVPVDGSLSAIQPVINTPVPNATVFANVSQISNVMAYVTGTFSAITCLFEGSMDSTNGTDGNWFAIQAVRSNANTVEGTTGALSAAPAYAWEMSVNALTFVRVRATVRTSGTQNWRFTLGSYATEPIPATQVTGTQPVSGTLTAVTTVTTVAVLAGGGVASGTVDAGNPIKIGAVAKTANPTAVADAARVNYIADKLGKQVVVGSIREMKVQQSTTIASSTAETTILAAVAATFLDLYGLIIANTSATACAVTIKDATAGTTRIVASILPGDTFTFLVPESAAYSQAAVNTSWTATCSASVASIVVTALAVKNT